MRETQYEMFGKEPPAQRHSETSVAAATAIKPKIGPLQAKILAFLRSRTGATGQRNSGATDEEMQELIPMGANTQRPRRRELELMGLVVDSGNRRLNASGKLAVVWTVRP
jgi:hypothetical protein